jgi:hypothetical protein
MVAGSLIMSQMYTVIARYATPYLWCMTVTTADCTMCIGCVDDVHILCYGRRAVSTDTTRIPHWLKVSRAEATQEWIASDIERVTGWHITRDRYSKYESGSLPVGPKVLGHFVDYWATRGVSGPDLPMATSGESTPSDVAALVASISELVAELRAAQAERDETARRLWALETAVRSLTNADGGADPTPVTPQRTGR